MKPKIYLFTDWFFPGYLAGGPIKSAVEMINLCGGELDFKVVTRNTDWNSNKPYEIEPDKWLHQNNYEIIYLSKNYLSFIYQILHSLEDSDIVFFNGIYSPQFNSLPIILSLILKKRSRIIISARGMLNQNAIKLKSFKKRLLLIVFRFLNIENLCVLHAASEGEVQSIKRIFPKSKVRLASNIPALPSLEPLIVKSSPFRKFVSVGRISPVKNTEFLVEIMSHFDELELTLIGTADDKEYLERCKNQARVSDGICFAGGVSPGKLNGLLNSYDFFILPTSGENFGHAIVEALALGIPVIISDQTPWSDLDSKGAGWVLPLSNPQDWKDVIEKAMTIDLEKYSHMQAMAKQYVQQKFKINQIHDEYLRLFFHAN